MVAVPVWVRNLMPQNPELNVQSVAVAIHRAGSVLDEGQALGVRVFVIVFRAILKENGWEAPSMVAIYDLDPASILEIAQVDLACLTEEPESPIGNFSFHGCTGGIGAFKGARPGSSTAAATNSCLC
jgi:hypothetical protein